MSREVQEFAYKKHVLIVGADPQQIQDVKVSVTEICETANACSGWFVGHQQNNPQDPSVPDHTLKINNQDFFATALEIITAEEPEDMTKEFQKRRLPFQIFALETERSFLMLSTPKQRALLYMLVGENVNQPEPVDVISLLLSKNAL